MEVVVSLSEGRTAAAQCGFFTYKLVPVIFEPTCMFYVLYTDGVLLKSDGVHGQYVRARVCVIHTSLFGFTRVLYRLCDS